MKSLRISLLSALLLLLDGSVASAFCTHHSTRHASYSTRLYEASSSTTSTSHNRAPNRKTQMRWVVQSIEKYRRQARQQQEPPSLQVTLKTTTTTTTNTRADPFQDTLEQLVEARTPEQVSQAGRILESLPIAATESFAVQERLVKVLAMSGLMTLALSLTDNMLNAGYIPSHVTQDAVCNTLRRSKKLTRLEQLVTRIGNVSIAMQAADGDLSTASFNIYLAALCDADATTLSLNRQELVERAQQWLQPDQAESRLGVVPDSISFATVLHEAASLDNTELANAVWNTMLEQQQQGGVAALISTNVYNARLRILCKRGADGDAKALQVWQDMCGDPRIQPDRYTIDLILLPLIRAGRIGPVQAILDKFVTTNSAATVSNSFAAFLLTICKGGEVSTARALFDIYVLPSLEPVVEGESVARLVRPTTRHFNAVIDAYRRMAAVTTSDYNNNNNSTEIETASNVPEDAPPNEFAREAWSLYRRMGKTSTTRPDPYTITSMLGLCQTPHEVTDILGQAVNEFGIDCSSAVLRATLTAYGELGDASSACWVFAKFLSSCKGQRDWNVLMGALSKAVAVHPESTSNLDVLAADATRPFSCDAMDQSFNGAQLALVNALTGVACVDAVQVLLDLMRGRVDIAESSLSIPSADSQTYCLAASALQYRATGADDALTIFRDATAAGIPADGRFINAVLRCFGADVKAALLAWKTEIRPACLAYENRVRNRPPSAYRPKGKNLLAAYNGLVYVCGRAARPDIGLRVVYAMNKEGLEANEVTLNCYRSGKRVPQSVPGSAKFRFAQTLKLFDPYESLLYVECTKYDKNDKRRAGEKRLRIIV